jgi:hypothetical protein
MVERRCRDALLGTESNHRKTGLDEPVQTRAELAAEEPTDGDTRRLTKRLRKYAEYIFTFLDYDHVPFENSFA